MKEETLSFLGLLRKGGNLIIGKAVEGALKKSALIIVAADAGEAVKKSIVDKASYYQKKVLLIGKKEELGNALGYPEISLLAILHPKAAKKVLLLEGLDRRKEQYEEKQ